MKDTANIKPRLVGLGGEIPREPFILPLGDDAVFILGRESVCDLQIKNNAVSRKHCRIISEDDAFAVEDLDSHNGTFVNDVPIKKRALGHGDRIRVGNAYFMFLVYENDDVPIAGAQFDDGTLVTDSMIQMIPNQSSGSFAPELNVLIKLGKAINEIRDTETLQRKILETILEFIPAQRGAILITDGDLEAAKVICTRAKNDDNHEPMNISRTISEQVLREQVALLSNDLSEKKLKKAESLIAQRITSLLCAPFQIGDRKGLIYLDTSDAGGRFTESHLQQITAVSFLVSAAIANAESIKNLRQENAILKDNLQIETNLVGESPAIKEVLHLIAKVAPSNSTVLITGESGTGKELIAQTIYRNSQRSEKPFVAVNCAVFNENLLESELFGHEKGAFTGAYAQKKGKFEIADGGTIFLDEVGDIAPSLQVKLLRILQEREFERVGGTKPLKVNVRVIAATNRDLEEDVKSGKFRRDLFFRLNVVQIKAPPLRARKSDITLLAQHFVRKYSERCHRQVVGLSGEAQKILLAGEWHGNVRELENVIERAVVLGTTEKILPEDLPSEMVENSSIASDFNSDFYEQLKHAKQRIISSALQTANGNYSEAARRLGVHPNNLHRIVRELGIKDDLKMRNERYN